MTLIELAERCERAEGPDRELDVAILTHPSIGYRDVHGDGMMFDKGNDGYWFVDDCSIRQLPSPTTSIDAALTLAPAGSLWATGNMEDGPFARLLWPNTDGTYVGNYVEGVAATPALALCAAALEARASMEGQTDG